MEDMENMRLKVYLAHERMTVKEFSELIKRTPSYVGSIASGRLKASYHMCEQIRDITGGKVTLQPSEKSAVVKKAKRMQA